MADCRSMVCDPNYMIGKAKSFRDKMIRAIFYYESDAQYKTYKGKAFYSMGKIFNMLSDV